MSSIPTFQDAISVPQGGGSIRGLGESFEPNLFAGSGSFRVPIPLPSARTGATPPLAAVYSAGQGNGILGLGWRLPAASVARKTETGIPRYDERDPLTLSSTDDLVPLLVPSATGWQAPASRVAGDWRVSWYRPRTERPFARIERWERAPGDVHWRCLTKDGATQVFGRTPAARVFDDARPEAVFEWLLEEWFDAKGNRIRYEYARDDEASAPPGPAERNRRHVQRYLRRILYGNSRVDAGPERVDLDDAALSRRYLFEVLLDYGDLGDDPVATEPTAPEEETTAGWPARPDPFSNYRAGFELRTLRRCERILVFHHFPELGTPRMVRSVRFSHRVEAATGMSMLRSIAVTEHRTTPAGRRSAPVPPIEFAYTQFDPRSQRLRTMTAPTGVPPTGALDDPAVQFVDLDGRGMPDLLDTTGGEYMVWRNRGGGVLDPPRRLLPAPGSVSLADPGVRLGDLAGDGRPDVIVLDGGEGGFFERADMGWAPYRRIPSLPGLSLADRNARLVDLTGNGLSDILVTTPGHLIWYECLGEDGYAAPRAVPRIHDLERFPDVMFDDPEDRVRLADMTGDGLPDIVVVRGRRVDYWPNLSRGRFGARVTMASAPDLPQPIDPRRLFLVDLDGSGCADLVYVDAGRVRYWHNRSGNGWSEGREVAGTPDASRSGAVCTDLLGAGTMAIVWGRRAGRAADGLRFLDLCGGRKPYLLSEMTNGRGARTRVAYGSSTQHRLADEARGSPWTTVLPFPIQVIDRMEVIDEISGSSLVTSYRYHDGCYAGRDREFRGFGRVDQIDAESFTPVAQPAAAGGQPLQVVPPVETRTWFRLGLPAAEAGDGRRGAYLGDAAAIRLGGDELPDGDAREALRALRGSVLRTEVFGLDDTPQAVHPYLVTERRHLVRRLQPASPGHPAVHHVVPVDELRHEHERDPSSPRTSHHLVLAVNKYGDVTEQATITYPRRGPTDDPQQAQLTALYTRDDVIARDEAELYLAGVVAQSRSYEVGGLQDPASRRALQAAQLAPVRVNPDDFLGPTQPFDATAGGVQKRIHSWRRSFYRDPATADQVDLGTRARRLALGAVGTVPLPYECCEAAFDDSLLQQGFGAATGLPVGPSDLEAAGHHREPDVAGWWWISSGQHSYDPGGFFTVTQRRDPFGNVAATTFDRYDLLPTRTEDAVGNVVQAEQDYRVLKPLRVTDQNSNVTEVAYDGHGLVIGVALVGKDGEADTLDGFEIEPDAGLLADPIGNADQLLAEATTRHIPDIWRYHRDGTPNAIHTLTRRRHAASGASALPVHAVTYADGFGREIQSKVEAEQEPGSGRRWVTTGWRVLNNKGKPVREFEPFFTSSADYEPDVRRGTSAVIVYDPLERQVATLLPNRTFQKQAITPWRRTQWDANDTVAIADPRSDADIGGLIPRLSDLGPSWYERRVGAQPGEVERDAAEKALAHADTPEVGHLDGQGRTVRTVRGDSASGVQQTRFRRNLRGDLIEVVDALNRSTLVQDFDLVGRRLRLRSLDAGEHWTVPDAAGRPVATLDARGVLTRLTYDALRRPLDVTVRVRPGAAERTVLRTVYGESAPDAVARNLRGRVLEHRDQAGIARSDHYDFKGNLLRASRQLIVAGQAPDWSANPAVSDEVFTSAWTYDALNRPLTRTLPDGTELQADYDARGQLDAIRVGRTGTAAADPILTSLVYDAHGRRMTCELANGAVTTYTYDPDVHRLTGARTVRGADVIQDLRYTFDPVGNVTTLRDDGQPTLFFRNAVVAPDAGYTYDSLYRLVRATGREHLGLTQAGSLAAAQPSSPSDAPRVGLAHPHDGRAVARYVQSYAYDAADNLKSVSHHAAGTGYVTRYDYRPPGNEPTSNRLRATSVPGDLDAGPFSARYGYDPAGNMTAMPHLDALEWDHRGQLRSVRRGTMRAFYDRDAAGQRVCKTVEKGAGLVEETIYLGDLEIFRRRVGGELRLERHTIRVSDDSNLIALVERVVRDERGPVADPAPVVRHQLVDHLGSSRVELDLDGAVISREEHYPFGGTALSTAKSAPGLSLKRYRYTGKERDEESGFYDVGARAYAPWLGRWTACDPAGIQDGMNLYLYARGNPIRFKDPTGRQSAEPSPPPPAAERLPSAASLLDVPSWATEPSRDQPESVRLINAYLGGVGEGLGAIAGGLGTAVKWFFWDNFGSLAYDITKADAYKQQSIDAHKGVRAIREFLLAGPDAAVANMGRGLVSGLDGMNAALRRGDSEEAMRGLGNFMGTIGPMLVGAEGPPSPNAINPALVTAEGVLIGSGMAAATGGPNLLPAGVVMMASAKAKTDGSSSRLPNGAPNKLYWNRQELFSLQWARKAFPGLRWYGQVELYRLAGDNVARLGRILDAMSQDILTGKLELHEWSTERCILEGRVKYSQLEYQLNVFNEARASSGSISIWGHPQGTNLLLDVTYAEQYIGTYLHWRP